MERWRSCAKRRLRDPFAKSRAVSDARTAVVVGANGGMGAAVTRALLQQGYHVAATVSRPDTLDAFLAAFPACSHAVPLDLSDAGAVKAQLTGLVENLPRLDAVVVCAAVAPFAPAETTDFDVFRQTVEINCLSNLAVYQSCLPALRRSAGRLLLTGSWSGKVATPMMASYVASKFALEGLVDVLRQEASAWGVQVVLIQPGALDTQMMRRSQASLAATIASLPESETALYGKLYRQMKYRADEGIANANFTAPEAVAATVCQALEATYPATRYPVGADAIYMCDMAATRSDREIDDFILDMYRSAPLDGIVEKSELSATE
ncbi:SDR family NAD(P)-dependent oxidoreductase [Sphingopyxis sp. SE2]|jgi:NAD(P)-dependent dehydrogenase (short-subunit alcohol dehydrogenase family)|uniref:SDR family NAD(P)-dependent oxidoreductase n=1 Tax=Sphingopyxis sp. SE2 TaxID=1586240 RepID=UPI0028C05BB3|nr:SDR family NAD(P)-dependent oxidoreductase [Sphingopyxis sp. SE2]MDT7529195.1 SDR family NAD(P)-dependent oxidoreductase [Sphingopyxis sp. SE2]